MKYIKKHFYTSHGVKTISLYIFNVQVIKTTHNETNVFDFTNPHVDLLALIDGQTNVEKIVFMGHAANFHEGQQVTFIVTSLVLITLKITRQNIWF